MADGVDPRDTRRALEAALAGGEAHHDADAATLTLVARLGAVTAEIGNRHEARRHFRRVADSGPAVLGPDHAAVRQARAYLNGAPSEARSVIRVTPIPRTPVVVAAPPVGGPDRRTPKRWIVAAVAIVALVAATGTTLAYRARQPHQPAPRLPAAPAEVAAVAAAGRATVTWLDPSDGRVAFVVSGGSSGATPDILQQVPAGQTSVTINGLNASVAYLLHRRRGLRNRPRGGIETRVHR